MAALAYCTIIQEYDWDIHSYPDTKDDIVQHALFTGPPAFLAIMAFLVPIVLNPWILGWPFLRKKKKVKQTANLPANSSRRNVTKDALGREVVVSLPTLMDANKQLNKEIQRAHNKPDVELGSLQTKEFSAVSPNTQGFNDRKRLDAKTLAKQQQYEDRLRQEAMYSVPYDNDPRGRRGGGGRKVRDRSPLGEV